MGGREAVCAFDGVSSWGWQARNGPLLKQEMADLTWQSRIGPLLKQDDLTCGGAGCLVWAWWCVCSDG